MQWSFRGLTDLMLPPAKGKNFGASQTISLSEFTNATKNCQSCGLHAGRKRVVLGTGNESARLMIVLPAPSMETESNDYPYSGTSAKLLRKMIQAINLNLAEVYSTPVLKCAPRKGRSISDAEILECQQHLQKEIQIVKPEFILSMGELAARTLLRTDANLGSLRGNWELFLNIPLLCTWEAELLLNSPDRKREAWADLKMLMARMRP